MPAWLSIASAHASALLTVCNLRTVSAFVQIACFHDVSTIHQKDQPLRNAEQRQHVPPPGQNVLGAERGQLDNRQSIDEISRSQRGGRPLDEKDVRDYHLTDLRNQFAIVPQEIPLFSTTIAENIRYGNLQATDEQVVAAAKAAQANQFICALPEQYDRGSRLSGGQRQQIALTRAFLRDAPS
ncbi:MAG TPA: ATP-binding cassette domain-containing protein [Nitrospira sp.]